MDLIIKIFGWIWTVIMYVGMIAFPIVLLLFIVGSIVNAFKKKR